MSWPSVQTVISTFVCCFFFDIEIEEKMPRLVPVVDIQCDLLGVCVC